MWEGLSSVSARDNRKKRVYISTNLSVTYLSSLKFEVAKHSEILMCVSQAGQERLSTVVKQKA